MEHCGENRFADIKCIVPAVLLEMPPGIIYIRELSKGESLGLGRMEYRYFPALKRQQGGGHFSTSKTKRAMRRRSVDRNCDLRFRKIISP